VGLLVDWNSSIFAGEVIYSSKFAITIHLTAQHNAEKWKLTNIYGPYQGRNRQDFVDCLNSIQILEDENWLFVGDFNFYRSLENRNREVSNVQDIMVFNSIISNLGLQEIPLKGRKFTWSNMQQEPLLEHLTSVLLLIGYLIIPILSCTPWLESLLIILPVWSKLVLLGLRLKFLGLRISG
jgi:hypothetical protein